MFASRCSSLAQRSAACRSTLFVHPWAPSLAAFSTSAVARHNTSAASTVAQNVQSSAQTTTSPKSTKPVVQTKSQNQRKPKQEEPREFTMQEQLEQLDRLHGMEGQMPFDIWAQPLETFDVHIPAWYSKRKGASPLDHLRAYWTSQMNFFRNAVSMHRIATAQSFPGVKVQRVWSLNLFRVQSTPWLKPFLKIALDTYKEVNQAVAAADSKTLKTLTVADYYDQLHKRLRNQNPNLVYVWKFHGENQPTKVVSIRAAEVNMSRQPLKFGSRLAVQALVRFDTMQSLEVFTKKGDRVAGDGTPKRVVEYLNFQKRMWYDKPWTIRGQVYEELEGEYRNNMEPASVRVRA